jgi:predicted nucleic acid-binding protein
VIVLDASVLANLVADDGPSGAAARARLTAAGEASIPDLADVETFAVLRKRWLAGDLTEARFRNAIDDLLALPLARYPVGLLMPRAYELRANVAAYDAAYIALAEALVCTLITGDARLVAAPGTDCDIERLTA